jgi:single-stranded-DNA-specific exonuclease
VIRVGRNWRAAPYCYAQAHVLSAELGVSAATASVLVRRGLGDLASARRFLAAEETHDPFEFRGMEEAAELCLDHVRRGSMIAIHGDYDVDGVCSTALLVRVLRALGATVMARLPSRMEEGYGLSSHAIEQLRAHGAELLITADCGIGALEQVALARRLGMDVVVTDHHRPGAELPDCPLVHPTVCGYPCPDLCATGVAFKLAQALHRTAGREPAELDQELDLVALATVADVVPLLGENRTLVKDGLRALAGTEKPGLRALMRVAQVEPQAVREHTIGFVLAPRINAAGRLYRADAALELLLTEDAGRALQVARELDAVNSERQAVETRILFEAEGQLSAALERREDPLYILAGEAWHPGVIGIVASRMVERYHRPCVLVALDSKGNGRGSGRSVAAYDLHAGLSACAHHLERFGGHRMAAGLELEATRLDSFRTELVGHARSILRSEDLVPMDVVDAVVPGDAVGLSLAEELERLRPFGMGNPAVNLLVPAARVSDVRPMGKGRHARLTVHSAGVRTAAVAFGAGPGLSVERSGETEPRHDLVARLEANEWQGVVAPRLVVRSLRPVERATIEAQQGDARAGCAQCACRARGPDWWRAVWHEFDAPLDGEQHVFPRGESRNIVDVRGCGVIGSLSDLLSTGESVAVTCWDCSRRRALLEDELHSARFDRPEAFVFSGRCAPGAIAQRLESLSSKAFSLVDYETIAREPSLLERFTHVFALDPPALEHLARLLSDSAPRGGDPAFLHLGWGQSEVELTSKALEQEYGLRGPLGALYRALSQHPEGASDAELEGLFAGDGRHPRSPALVGRCLCVLGELGLVELERSSATVRCTIISNGRVELERSRAFREYGALYEKAVRFLGEKAQPRRKARAA